eukprot:m.182809 g.182809  ORF g.182809 m.182809 type:complete len:473 (+) comp32134_c0_seq1:140-1558(+)
MITMYMYTCRSRTSMCVLLQILLSVADDVSGSLISPMYTATQPNYEKPNAGLPLITGALHQVIFTPDPRRDGTYSHGAQIERHNGVFHVSWNNSPFNEDQDGQRVLYASSTPDGQTWSDPVDLFPSMPASQFGCNHDGFCWDKIHHHHLPYVTLNGRLYGVSNLRRHEQGAYFYPVPPNDLNATLLRRVLQPARLTPGGCAEGTAPSAACPLNSMRWLRPAFGPMFWATDVIPQGMTNVTNAFGIRTATPDTLSPEEAADFAAFRDIAHARSYSNESCCNGLCGPKMGEQTVYSLTNSSIDVILYRGVGGDLPHGWPGDQACANASSCVLLASSHDSAHTGANWTSVVPTNIPDLGSNLNAGTIGDGWVFLVWNGVPRPSVNDTACGRLSPVRNPLTLAISTDGGRVFDKVWALYNNTRPKKYCGSAKPFGPSYPQARAVMDEGGSLDGLWTTYSINKEEVGVTFAPMASLV